MAVHRGGITVLCFPADPTSENLGKQAAALEAILQSQSHELGCHTLEEYAAFLAKHQGGPEEELARDMLRAAGLPALASVPGIKYLISLALRPLQPDPFDIT